MFWKRKKRHAQTKKGCRASVMALWVAAVSVLVLYLVVFCMVGGYAHTFHMLRGYVPLLPLWLFGILDWLCVASGGVALGSILFEGRLYEERRFRCAFFLVLALTLGYFWFALFFGAHVFLLAGLLSIAALFSTLASLACIRRCPRGAFLFLLLFLYRFFVSIFCLFSF